MLHLVWAVSAMIALSPAKLPSTNAQAGTPLVDAVRSFNARAAQDPIGKVQPPLTVDEVVAAIQWTAYEHQNLPVSAAELRAFQHVADTRMLPPGAEFEVLTRFEPDELHVFSGWSVRLRMPRETGGGTYAFPVRERWISSRPIGPHERAIIEKWQRIWRKQGGIASFDRVPYAEERRKAAEQDGYRETAPPQGKPQHYGPSAP